jgi:hypothetical protein
VTTHNAMHRANLMLFMALAFTAVDGAAQDKPKVETDKATEVKIPEELKSKFFKAQAQYERAQIEAEQVKTDVANATAALQQAVDDVTKRCGDGKVFALNQQTGDPGCATAPKQEKK